MTTTAPDVGTRPAEPARAGILAKAPFRRRPSLEEAVAFGVVGATTLFVLWQLHPSLLLQNAAPVRGDLPAHFRTAQLLRDELLPRGHITGWSQDWFTGYPVLTFYFPLGSILTALVSYVLPLPVALKLVAACGPLLLPAAAYAFARLNDRDRLSAACFSVAVIPLLQMEGLLFVGGTISTMAVGEYGYGLALTLGLLTLGVAQRGLRTGRHRALAAALLAATVLFHIIPAGMMVLGIVVSTLIKPNWPKVRWTASVFAVALGLTSFWVVPFLLRLPLTGGSDFSRYPVNLKTLFPPGIAPLAVVVALGVVLTVLAVASGTRKLDRLEPFLLAMAGLAVVMMLVTPEGQVLNARFLPFWILFLCLLGGSLLGRLAHEVDGYRKRARRGAPLPTPSLARLVVPAIFLVAVVPLEDSRLGDGLLEHVEHISVEGYLEGYTSSARRVEYADFTKTIRNVGAEHGCARALWENSDEDIGELGLMSLMPYWTDRCITASEGLYHEATASLPYLDATNQRLSTGERAGPKKKRAFDTSKGAEDLRLLGMRYFVTSNAGTRAGVEASDDFRRLACTAAHGPRTWCVYEVTDSTQLVEPLDATPVVVEGAGGSRTGWMAVAEPWYDDIAQRDVRIAASGPSDWPRRSSAANLPHEPTGQTAVSDIQINDRRISFRVSEPGVPVLVKVSYFPNWRARGAKGPYRVSPNHMVVVPTSNSVSLRYQNTSAENAGMALTLVALAGLVLLWRRGAVEMPVPEVVEELPPPKRPAQKRKPKKKKRR